MGSNHRPSGYEPDTLTSAPPRYYINSGYIGSIQHRNHRRDPEHGMRDTLIAIGIEPTEGFIKRVLDCMIAVYIRVGETPRPPLGRIEGGGEMSDDR